jgi:hypothetical protein
MISAAVAALWLAGCTYPDIGSHEREDLGGSDDEVVTQREPRSAPAPEDDPEGGAVPDALDTNEGRLEVAGEVDEALLEGDILTEPDAAPSIAGSRATSKPWPNGVVPYTIAGNLPNQKRVTDAIAHWQARTSLRFVKRTNEVAYVDFVPSTGCSSYIGRIGKRQPINLAAACTTGSTIHEIGHAVGLWHEQSRSDRDRYVKILTANIQAGHAGNFTKTAFASPGAYDLGSIMHYGSTYFSANGRPTMTRLDGKLIVPNRSALSTGDIAGIKVLYGAAAPVAPPADTSAATVEQPLNLRAGPGTTFKILATMPAGATVKRTGKSESGFDAVTYEGTAGWAYAEYLTR